MWKLRNEGVTALDKIMQFNSGQDLTELKECNEMELEHLTEVVKIINDNIHKPIWIVNDYDCDGDCAGIIAYLTCSQAGGNPILRTPRRFSEGYGISHIIVDEIISKSKTGLVIMVDNGIVAIDQVKRLKEAGFTVVILDHHKAQTDASGKVVFPNADIIIDPSAEQHDTTAKGYTPYCGAGLALKVMEAYDEIFGGISERAMNTAKILAGFATVADVVDVKNGNRRIIIDCINLVRRIMAGEEILVTAGMLKLLQQTANTHFDEGSIGFQIGPMFNAPERLKDGGSNAVFKAIMAPDEKQAERYISQLVVYNESRKKKSDAEKAFALEEIAFNGLDQNKIIILASPTFSEGLCGIVAGKITDKFHRPCIVFTEREDGLLKGSSRSVDEVDIFKLLNDVRPYLLKFGGHSKAAGLSIKKENLDAFINATNDKLNDVKYDTETMYYDTDIELCDVATTYETLQEYAPFGEGNPKPVFRVNGFSLNPHNSDFYRFMGENKEHFKIWGAHGVEATGFWLSEMAAEKEYPRCIDLLCTLSENVYLGNSTSQLELIDFEPHTEKHMKTDLSKALLDRMSTFCL